MSEGRATSGPGVRVVRVGAAATSTHPEDDAADVAVDSAAPTDVARSTGVVVGGVGRPDRDGRTAVEVVVDGWRFEFAVEDATRAALRDRATRARTGAGIGGGSFEIRAIIPGRVVAVLVAAGDEVEAGDPLLVVEAMKMQNELRAPRAGSVAKVAVGAGATVDLGDVLVVLG